MYSHGEKRCGAVSPNIQTTDEECEVTLYLTSAFIRSFNHEGN